MRECDLVLDYSNMMAEVVGRSIGVTLKDINGMRKELAAIHSLLKDRVGPGADMLGFLDLPYAMDTKEGTALVRDIKATADRLAELAGSHLVLGVGGSALGPQAIVSALCSPYHNELTHTARRQRPRMYFAGDNLDSGHLSALLRHLQEGGRSDYEKSFTVNVISKSGTTIETLVAFRFARSLLKKKFGRAHSNYVVVTTDPGKGPLPRIADASRYKRYDIPADVGGRFSVLSPVGLLPAAVAGIDIVELLAGARAMAERCSSESVLENPSYMYATLVHVSALKGMVVGFLFSWLSALEVFNMWHDQMVAESLGKEEIGRIPVSCVCTRDLHSRGQQAQQGMRNAVVTHITANKPHRDLTVSGVPGDPDQLNYLSGKTLHSMLRAATEGTIHAYALDCRPGITLAVPELSPFSMGELFYFFELATVVEGYLSGINPMDQPGVEKYKNYMYGILGRVDKRAYKDEFRRRRKAGKGHTV